MLVIHRYLGFRHVDELTEESDYTFTLTHGGKWTFQSLKNQTEVSGEISENWEEIKAALLRIEFPKNEEAVLNIPDLPQFTIQIAADEGESRKYQLQPKDDLARNLHAFILQWRSGKFPVPRLIVQQLDVQVPDKLEMGGAFREPAVIDSKEALLAQCESQELVDSISRLVDFSKKKLVVFTWAGSGQDQLDYEISLAEKKVVFDRIPGFTRDYREHQRTYVIDASYEVEIKQPEKR
ncbi:MAG TPA: hypothetical protein PKD64_03480 [Pirellulaceae bacterium]|nr:hypothetical protein [Pirellulaceae bacterium]HMO91232.1 hypothetical protein [Pirellulaceae bacterium]HMP68584.1 hypothetical protein [Pirellulaceae bacterium]